MYSPETKKNACLFYNSVDSEGVRWITYQFQEQSELTFPDEDAKAAVAMLLPSNPDN